jgi:hypothetical protein
MHTPCITKQARKKMLEIFYEKVAKGMLASAGSENQSARSD